MAGNKGRGRAAYTFNIEAVGFSRGEKLPDVVLKPPPLFPVSTLTAKFSECLFMFQTKFKLYIGLECISLCYLLTLLQGKEENIKE